MKARKVSEIKLSSEERETLERYVRRRKTARYMAQRGEIILRAAAGENNCEIARVVQVTRQTVRVWRERFSRRPCMVLTMNPEHLNYIPFDRERESECCNQAKLSGPQITFVSTVSLMLMIVAFLTLCKVADRTPVSRHAR